MSTLRRYSDEEALAILDRLDESAATLDELVHVAGLKLHDCGEVLLGMEGALLIGWRQLGSSSTGTRKLYALSFKGHLYLVRLRAMAAGQALLDQLEVKE